MDGTTRDMDQGKGKGTGRTCKGASRAPRWAATERMEWSGARSANVGAAKGMDTGTGRIRVLAVQARAQVTVGRIHGVDRETKAWGPGRGPRARARGTWAPGDRQDGSREPRGEGGAKGRATGRGAPPQPDVQPVRCIPPGIQQMRAHHTHHHHHQHAHLYNIDPDAGDFVAPQPPRPQHQPAPPAPRAEPARMAAAPAAGGRGAAPAPQAQGPQGEQLRGAEGARPWDRDLHAVPDPLGGEALPLVVEVYGWLSWACSGTTRGMRNRPFDAVLLWRDGGNREMPQGGWAAPEDHRRVLRAVIRAAWPDREPTWPAFPEGGAVPRITNADANNWLPRVLRNARFHWRYRRRNPLPPEPQPPRKRRRRGRPRPAGPGDEHEGVGKGQCHRTPPPSRAGPPDPERDPHPPPRTTRRRGAHHLQ